MNHHRLSDFRVEHQAALDELFAQVLAAMPGGKEPHRPWGGQGTPCGRLVANRWMCVSMAGMNRGGFANAIGPAPNAKASHSLPFMPALYHSLRALPVIRFATSSQIAT